MSTYEPPLVESVLLKGGHRPVIVGKSLHGNIIPPHGRVIESLAWGEDKSKPETQRSRYQCEP